MRVCEGGGLRSSIEDAVPDWMVSCNAEASVDSVDGASSRTMGCCDDDGSVDAVATVTVAGSKGREL